MSAINFATVEGQMDWTKTIEKEHNTRAKWLAEYGSEEYKPAPRMVKVKKQSMLPQEPVPVEAPVAAVDPEETPRALTHQEVLRKMQVRQELIRVALAACLLPLGRDASYDLPSPPSPLLFSLPHPLRTASGTWHRRRCTLWRSSPSSLVNTTGARRCKKSEAPRARAPHLGPDSFALPGGEPVLALTFADPMSRLWVRHAWLVADRARWGDIALAFSGLLVNQPTTA
jgi:hypothetical protein